jgi:putative oxidoreductase
VTSGGWEYNAVLIAAILGDLENGPGKLSLDRRLGLNLRGYGWVLFSLAGALAGPKLASEALAYRRRQGADAVDNLCTVVSTSGNRPSRLRSSLRR